ncbi:MAG TPA: hypothetical protein VGH80_03290 [Xanthomonadaceae bacterium]|jgi:energy-coupling factor transporter ATP-binding protein EcfA2
MNTRSLFLASIVSSTVLAALSGCGKSTSQSAAEAMVSAATGGKVQVSQSGDQQQMTIKDDKGNVMKVNSGNGVALPKDFPSDVHLPGSYTIKSAVQIGPTTALNMHTSDTMQSLYAEYDTSMKSGGWTEAMAMQSSDKESVLTFQKDKRSVVVSIVASSDGGGADVSLQSTAEQK